MTRRTLFGVRLASTKKFDGAGLGSTRTATGRKPELSPSFFDGKGKWTQGKWTQGEWTRPYARRTADHEAVSGGERSSTAEFTGRLPDSLAEVPGVLDDFATGMPLRCQPSPNLNFLLDSVDTDGGIFHRRGSDATGCWSRR